MAFDLAAASIFGFRNHIALAGSAAEGTVTPQTFIQDGVMNQRGTALVLQYAKMNNVRNIPCAMCAAQTYDAMYLLLNGLFRAPNMDGPSIRHVLETLNQRMPGVIATYQNPFSRTDHEALDGSILLLGQVKHGLVQYANPGDAKRAVLSSGSKLAARR